MRSTRAKEVVKAEVKESVRQKLNVQQLPSDLFDPAGSLAGLDDHAKLKEWASAGRGAALRLGKQENRSSNKELLELVERQLATVYDRATAGQPDVATIKSEFAEWRGDHGYEAWPFFTAKQGPVAAEAKEVEKIQKQVRDRADNSGRATQLAVSLRKQHPNGPDNVVGTVIAGLADSAGGGWTGTSGHGTALHPVMATLLNGVNQVEEWPVAACGEVDAMNQYLHALNIKSVKDIPAGGLFSHAETWAGRKGRWQSRGACYNCEQWLNKIKAHMA